MQRFPIYCLSFLLIILVSLPVAFAAEPSDPIEIWPGAVPGEKGDVGEETSTQGQGAKPVRRVTNVTRPTITCYKPPEDKDTGAAVLICPGGGYNILAMDLEGEEVAEWLNSIGVTGVILKYRVPRRKGQPPHLAPLQDAQRAMSIVRGRAKEWRIDPSRIGILGFSAGGHLSATAGTNFDNRQYAAIDDVDRLSCRPDFIVLVYPAYMLDGEQLVPELPVSEKTPPTFFAHAADDKLSCEGSIRFFLELKRNKVPGELHVYSSGGHGFGLRPSQHPASTWPGRCEAWMKAMGWLERH